MKQTIELVLRGQSRVLAVLSILGMLAARDTDAPGELSGTPVSGLLQDPVALERGEALFTGTCAGVCHSLTPEEVESSYLFDCQWDHGETDDELFATITNGIPNTSMVGFGANSSSSVSP